MTQPDPTPNGVGAGYYLLGCDNETIWIPQTPTHWRPLPEPPEVSP